ncbi:alpha-L-arabinofuranosidase C-terminal domain-containing protein [uncultured Bacteroides sp.]|uniref:alpha-L-arabinofuranosidase C-terminal domain-containing protein n=1 Tax=uncultured Bacteroides sp. TaxID=162156 RepID=UPI002AAB0136|nr:alpha-L-arabinofuranosidase C-terminal domain-containing protein [uncultured Bacteroides sp.]
MKIHRTLFSAFALFMGISINAQTEHEMVVKANKPGAEIQSTMYGLFFEDINYGADGGLYAELVKNRSFEFPQNLMGWKTFGHVEVRTDNPAFDKNPHYVRLSDAGHKEKHTGLENEGFFGVGIHKDAQYHFSVWARLPQGSEKQEFRIELVNSNNDPVVKQVVAVTSSEWKKYQIVLTSPITDDKAILRIFLTSKGDIDMDHISLFPVDTWKGRENGLRKDLVKALADLKPGVFRFPGGCIVEGTDLNTRYNWKNTVGPVENRPLNENRWHYTFPNRFNPDYYQTYGLGFYEFFLLSEEIGSEPLPIVNCGMACQFQNKDLKAHVPVDKLDSYIQDALDLIEFANGDVTTKWGEVRSEMGHPAPFNLKLIGVGNEQWGKEYMERLEPFIKAIRKAYPKIRIVGTSGPDSEGDKFDYAWPEMKRLKADLVDEHFYRPQKWFLSQAARYDNYDRKGPKVFAGEYACHPKNGKNNFDAALCEAAFMTGLERNADVVHMATYAPLFAHVKGWQWRPDLIWFDNLSSVCSVNYYVQQLYSQNKGTNVLSLTMDKKPVTGQDELYASAVWDKNEKAYIVKIANTADKEQGVRVVFEGVKKGQLSDGTITTLHSSDLDAENTLAKPNTVIPEKAEVVMTDNVLSVKLSAKTFAVYKLLKK